MSVKAVIFEEHSSSLAHWWRARTRPRTLVCLDAHLDLQYINDDRLRRLQECTSAEQIEALAKPHHLSPDRGFSYSLENFLFAAARLGLIDRLVWVAPPHVRTAYSPGNFERLCQMDGVRLDEVGSLKKGVGGCVEGRLLGLSITICDYLQLEQLSLPSDSLIDIDIDYFVALPADEAWVNPRAVFEVLRRLPLTPTLVSISRSVESGFTPLRYRFFADYLAALWEEREKDGSHYDRLFSLERRLRADERDSLLADCLQESQSHPECAATCYLLGLVGRNAEQTRAASLSNAYRPNLLRSACEIRSRQLIVQLDEVLRLRRRAADSPLDRQEQGLVERECGLIFAAFGNLGHAIECYRGATELLGEHPELALEIARLYVDIGQETPALALLQTALEDDKTRTAAHLLLAQINIKRGFLEQAQQHLELASEAAPAWVHLLDMLAFVHQRLGNSGLSQALGERAEIQRQEGERLARQLR